MDQGNNDSASCNYMYSDVAKKTIVLDVACCTCTVYSINACFRRPHAA